jgi:hypothetical protein
MLDIEIIKMAFTWTLVSLAIQGQHFFDGYTYNTIWLTAVTPFILWFMNGSSYLNVQFWFIFVAAIFTGALTFMFSLVRPQLAGGLREYGKDKKNTGRIIGLHSGMFLFVLLVLGHLSVNPFAPARVVQYINNAGNNVGNSLLSNA